MEMDIYTPLEKHTQDIYTTVELTKDKKEGQMEADPVPPANVDYRMCLFNILLFLSTLLIVVVVIIAVYHFTHYKEMTKNLSTLQFQFEQLNKIVRPLDKFCPLREPPALVKMCSVCPHNWLLFDSKCYLFSTDKQNWYDSQDTCTSEGGHLVIIETKEEQDILTALLEIKGSEEKSYWIGLTDEIKEGHFVWVDNKPLDPQKAFWGKRQNDNGTEPDHWTDELNNPFGQNCVCLQKKKPSSGWYGLNCENQKKRICEAAASTFPSRI
uniref:CD209 antigen-like protein E n=1 Tax=Erpetoichthys calabaricus TaxID=27687 RepID=A0A8C4T600_ERPCA